MKRATWITALMSAVMPVVGVFLAPGGSASGSDKHVDAATVSPGSAPVQPAKEQIPGTWDFREQPLPPLEQARKVLAGKGPVFGLYVWADGLTRFKDGIVKIGWKTIRIGGPLTDDDMKVMLQDDYRDVRFMKTLGLRNFVGKSKANRTDFQTDEEFLDAYVKSVEAFLERYGPEGAFFKENPSLPTRPITFIEIWNEPNFQYMIPDREPRAAVEKEREALYAKVLPASYAAVKKRWPTVTVLGFGEGGASRGDVRFIAHVLSANDQTARSFDVLSTHPYMTPAPPEAWFVKPWGGYAMAESLKDIRAVMAKAGTGDKPIWYTELGWPISQEDGGAFQTAPDRVVPPLLQAAYVVRSYAMAMRLGVERACIMYVTDADGFNGGFFARNGTWRPSAAAAQTMIKVLPDPAISKAISDGKDGYFCYGLIADTRLGAKQAPTFMVWNVTGPKTIESPVAGNKATVMDMLGGIKEVAAKDGKVTIEVGPCPVYVR